MHAGKGRVYLYQSSKIEKKKKREMRPSFLMLGWKEGNKQHFGKEEEAKRLHRNQSIGTRDLWDRISGLSCKT